MKINARKVQQEIEQFGKDWKGIRIVVLITIQNKEFTLSVENNASCLLLKELGPKYYERKRKQPQIEKHTGNLTLDQVKKVAKILDLDGKNLSKTFAGCVKSVLGTV